MNTLTRRHFIRSSSMGAGALLVGFQLPALGNSPKSLERLEGAAKPLMTDAFIRINPDNTTTVLMNHAEFGNGAYTSLAMMIAEELPLDWDTIRIEAAPTEKQYYSPLFGEYLTAGSVSTASSLIPMRTAGAKTRALLIAAAAKAFDVEESTLTASRSRVAAADGRSLTFAELVPVIHAFKLEPPATVSLKPASAFDVLGKPTRRIEGRDKVTGAAQFGIDVKRPNMLYGSIQRPPIFKGRVKTFDASRALEITGVVKVKAIDAGVVALAEDYWTAQKAARLIDVIWDTGDGNKWSTEGFFSEYRALSNEPGMLAEDIGDAERTLSQRPDAIEAVYELPYLAHATMEPMNCTAEVHQDRCDIWVGTQYQSNDRTLAAKALGMDESQVTIHRTLMGGTFGRRASKTADFVVEAVQAAMGEARPVQIIWSREEDIQQGGHYRPLFVHRLKGCVDEEGFPLAWHQRAVGQSIMQNTKHDPAYMVRGMDIYSLDGCLQAPFGVFPYGTSYQIPHHRIESHNPPKVGVYPHEWRAVGHTHTGIAYECFLDELAHLGGKDPLDVRLHLTKGHERMHALLKMLRQVSGWDEPMGAQKGRGVASRIYSVSPIANTVEVTVSDDGQYTVDRIVCVVDCGFAVNPLGIESQIHGGIMLGLNAAALGAIDIEEGKVLQSNFHDYIPLRFHQMPKVEVHIMPSVAPSTGVGEQASTAIGPALANAIFAATGQRVRQFPLSRHGFKLKG